MKKLGLFCLAILLLAVCTGTSYATIVEFDFPASMGTYSYTLNDFSLDITENLWEIGSVGFTVSGDLELDPIFYITKAVENTTGIEWIGYELTLDLLGDATFTGIAASDVFTLGSQSSYEIVFEGPDSLPNGGTVTFDLDILVPDSGPFSFTLTQTPILIPEPTTIALLSAGMLFLKRRSVSRERR